MAHIKEASNKQTRKDYYNVEYETKNQTTYLELIHNFQASRRIY